jgi:putative membrane protein
VVLAFDFLDLMAWDVALSAVLIGLGALKLPYNTGEGRIEEKAKSIRIGFAIATGASGFYLFLSGAIIGFMWPFTIANGAYNVLFGGIATLGGLVLLAGSVSLAFNANLKPITYFAGVAGIYGIVDAYSIIFYNLTSEPMLSSLGYLSFVAPALFSVPAAHLTNKKWRVVFAAFAFLFAAAWIYQAANFTFAHLKPA